jgi:hypothetical protein
MLNRSGWLMAYSVWFVCPKLYAIGYQPYASTRASEAF